MERTIKRRIVCARPFCRGCQYHELGQEIYDAGLSSRVLQNFCGVDVARWDRLDEAMGIRTRPLVEYVASKAGEDACFDYHIPALYVDDWVLPCIRERVDSAGASVSGRFGVSVISWNLSYCGLPTISRGISLRIKLVGKEQLRREALDYCKSEGKPEPRDEEELLRCMKNTVRHQYTEYDYVRSVFQSRGPGLKPEGVVALRSVFDEEIDRVYPYLASVLSGPVVSVSHTTVVE